MISAPPLSPISPPSFYITPSPSPPPGQKRKPGPRYISTESLPRGDYKIGKYNLTRTERNVFGTMPYSSRIKELWRFKDMESADRSAENIWSCFKCYREVRDFVGKFLQMGRTRSLRYALRKGGKKYTTNEEGEKVAMERTGEVYDEEKLAGSEIFELFENKCWEDETYGELWVEWGGKEKDLRPTSNRKRDSDEQSEEEIHDEPGTRRMRSGKVVSTKGKENKERIEETEGDQTRKRGENGDSAPEASDSKRRRTTKGK